MAGQGEADAQRLQDASRSGAGVHQLVKDKRRGKRILVTIQCLTRSLCSHLLTFLNSLPSTLHVPNFLPTFLIQICTSSRHASPHLNLTHISSVCLTTLSSSTLFDRQIHFNEAAMCAQLLPFLPSSVPFPLHFFSFFYSLSVHLTLVSAYLILLICVCVCMCVYHTARNNSLILWITSSCPRTGP